MDTDWGPLGEAEFLNALHALACKEAPALFALCEEIGHRASGHVEYWGLSFPEYAALTHVDGNAVGSFRSAESAHRLFSTTTPLHLVWV